MSRLRKHRVTMVKGRRQVARFIVWAEATRDAKAKVEADAPDGWRVVLVTSDVAAARVNAFRPARTQRTRAT